MIFLNAHPNHYFLSGNEMLVSMITCFSGYAYAKRHWELSTLGINSWAHRIIASLEYLPIVGGIISVIERIFFECVISKIFTTAPPVYLSTWWTPHVGMTSEQAQKKMERNLEKAILEHGTNSTVYISIEDFKCYQKQWINDSPAIELERQLGEWTGVRERNEDTHLFKTVWGPDNRVLGVLSIVLDGHGGAIVAEEVRDYFCEYFDQILEECGNEPYQAFEKSIDRIERHICQRNDLSHQGTTAVFCFIQTQTSQIFTATLGDCEANIYRKIHSSLKSIPLSCVRDWKSSKDKERAELALEMPLEQIKPNQGLNSTSPSKAWRFGLKDDLRGVGCNVSRSIGDANLKLLYNHPGLTHKPKITVHKLRPGDILIQASDGLKDFVDEKAIVDLLEQSQIPFDQLMIKVKEQSKDNTTIAFFKVKEAFR